MGSQDKLPRLISIAGPATILVIIASAAIFLPREIRVVLILWMLASFPVGVLFGHCVLSEKKI